MKELEKLREECLRCRDCSIGGQMIEGHLSNVFSNMSTGSRIMVVGQNPGHDEVIQGIPFVGASGKFFDEAITGICSLKRSDLYISNCVRCFTPSNRHPYSNEKNNCRKFLDREIEIINPTIIVALGSAAFKQLTGMSGIMKHHGKMVVSPRYQKYVLPILHPSPYNTNHPEKRKMFYEDLKALAIVTESIKDE